MAHFSLSFKLKLVYIIHEIKYALLYFNAFVHPNTEAIQITWKCFSLCWFLARALIASLNVRISWLIITSLIFSILRISAPRWTVLSIYSLIYLFMCTYVLLFFFVLLIFKIVKGMIIHFSSYKYGAFNNNHRWCQDH